MPEQSETSSTPRDDMVRKALRLLVLLGEAPHGTTLSDLARQAGYPVSTTHRLLKSIAQEDFAVLDEERRWNLGLRLFELGQRVLHARGFTEIATPALERVTRQTGEPTLMSVLDGHDQLYVHFVEGTQQIQITGEPGQRGPLHCTSMGKCLIAFAAEPERDKLVAELDLPKMGPKTITERDPFRTEIERVREQGYALADEEHESDIIAIGVPVLNPSGVAVAALSTAAPAFRSSLEQLRTYLEPLRRAAKELAIGLPRR
ncbi:IclR family transcriptional regulator [Parasphingorhabdus pacifica]